MNSLLRFVKDHPVLSSVGGVLAGLALLAGVLVLDARGTFGADVFSDLPENDAKLRAVSLPTVAPGPDGPGMEPTFLVLGSTHLSQDDDSVATAERERIVRALSAFRPDMLVVEQLPPDWPRGKGRDYRPDFEMEEYADRWVDPRDYLPPS